MLVKPPDGGSKHEPTRTRDFDSLYGMYHLRLWKLARTLSYSYEDACDLNQETWIKIYRALASYDPSRPFLSWASKIMHGVSIDRWRKSHRVPLVSLESYTANYSTVMDDNPVLEDHSTVDPSDEAVAGVLMTQAMEDLPERFREILWLLSCGLSYQGIANSLETSIGTVRSRIHRGRRLLRLRLDEIDAETNSI